LIILRLHVDKGTDFGLYLNLEGKTPNRSMKLSVRLILLIIATTLIQSAFGQDELLLRGALKDSETQKKLDNCQVTVFKNGQQFDVYDTGGSGKYEFRLELGYSYDIKFSRVD